MSASQNQLDYEEQLARIHDFNMEVSRKLAEINNLDANASLADANRDKTQAEIKRLIAETQVMGWQTAFAGFTAGAAVLGVIIGVLKLWGGA